MHQLAAPAPPPAPTPTPTYTPPPAPSIATSPNWSGYIVPSTSSLITDASGEWTVPTLDCSTTPNAGATTWVGIGGVSLPTGGSSGALLQTGVNTNCVNGIQEDEGWWEEFPTSPNHQFTYTGFSVSPGDIVSASVYQSGTGSWVTRVDDLTTGSSGWMITGEGWGVTIDSGNGVFTDQGSAVDISYSGGYTAEWIEEDYGQGISGALMPFVDYGTVSFSGLTTSLSSWSLTPGEAIEIAQNGVVLSTPSAPSNDGFSVSYTG
ncbi:MAG: G1 family glutamic endopeptidase [Deltaproteobacteria bacterium]